MSNHPLENDDKVDESTKKLVDASELGLGESSGMDLVTNHNRYYKHKTFDIYFAPMQPDVLDGRYNIISPFGNPSISPYIKEVEWYYVQERVKDNIFEPCEAEEVELALNIIDAIEKLNNYRK